jgi:tetratricopeptide (TPR) repeat protein
LRETDLGLQYGNKQNIVDVFTREMGRLIDGAVAEYLEAAAQRGLPADWNKLGIAYARFIRYPQAVKAFEKAIKVDRGFLPARINLANVLYLQQDYTKARGSYEALVRELEQKGRGTSGTMLKLLINLSRACYMLEDFKNAGEYYEKAEKIDPGTAEDFGYLAQAATSSDTARSAEGADLGSEILFIEEGEE